jgi:hypothetical protein
MFLPTKAHTKEIVDNQFKIRLGNRVPKDAVNLAYAHIPGINADENVLITDLSNTILENTRNSEAVDIYMYPDNSLVLQMGDDQLELPTEDVIVTNVFKDGVPLYYSHRLTYLYYDQKGPDEYGIYQRNGISIIDHNGQPVTRPYQVQLLKDPNHFNLYYVVIYTSFKDKESDTYEVVYNAIKVDQDGKTTTVAGRRETLNLKRAFQRVETVEEILTLIETNQVLPTYYQAHGSSPGYSKFYVPSPRIKDTREYQRFRYQIGVEIETANDRYIYTTPWYSNRVLNPNYLNPSELGDYENGYKRLTEKTAQAILLPYVPYEYMEDRYNTFRYFVNIDNPNVEEFFRTDGSSPVYATTTIEDEKNILTIPRNSKIIQLPVPIASEVKFRLRPLLASSSDVAYVSFIMDNSDSMNSNDPEKTLRLQMMESLIYSMKHYYSKHYINGFVFNQKVYDIRKDFKSAELDLVELYGGSILDNDVTNPTPAIARAFGELDKIAETETTYQTTFINHKMAVLITDGQFKTLKEVEDQLIAAKEKNIQLAIIVFNNHPALNQLCKEYNTLCIDAVSPRLMMELRYFFFNMAGLNNTIDLGVTIPFTIDPQDNEYMLYELTKDSFTIPPNILQEDHRWGVEALLDDEPWIPEISLYFKENATNIVIGTYNSANIVTLPNLFKFSGYKVYLHSEAWQFHYAPTYSVQFNDSRKIQVLPPRDKENHHNWYLRVKNGRFNRQILDDENKPTYSYSMPEYYRQGFIPELGLPYKQVKAERPVVLNESRFKVSCTPMRIDFDGDTVTNLTVTVNDKPLRVKSWSGFDGVIEVDGSITHNDEIYVDYQYEEDGFVYRGYYNEEDKTFWTLDLNPSRGHFITIKASIDGEIKDVPSFTLINKTIYIYMNPAAKMKQMATGEMKLTEQVRQATLFHTFEQIHSTDAVLLAEVRVRANSNQSNITFIDTRVRGGGLKKEITAAMMKEFEEESFMYWDIGHWDGEPYPENGVINIRLTRTVLKEYGGRFTRAEIESKLEKHLGYGIFPIIEFVDDPDSLVQIPEDLVVEVIDLDDQTTEIEKPTFRLTLEG